MQLTTEQIDQIEETLILNGIVYDDIKMEVLDHIATEIQVLMNKNTLSFDENLKKSLNSWSDDLKSGSSIFTGLSVKYPKIVLDKKVRVIKKQMFINLLVSLFLLSTFLVFSNFFNAKLLTYYFQFGFRFVFIIGYLLLIINTILIWNSKVNLSFYSHHKNKVAIYISWIYPFCFIKTPEGTIGQIMLVFTGAFMVIHLLFTSSLALKHFQFEKRLTRI
tara:strand:- start:457 stop:1113 length:657 start_codon:yes stop_codon:yes gene_type:complete